ncbi:helix-turn-helix domain-containing protein [Caulobacter endophyticus]|uniref:Transcriptional regulator n=1 Tax=Caulobacter endophyticus TaxID=2172652 RepID=A0A2T9JI38_9CAUL|nr:helix-turn-helix transcriptional regulator [Caulobacter endophyticus]PVM83364.1 transcriptional regulator [Caulobacter endophyticus]
MPRFSPHPVDQHVGARIRLRRLVVKVSQLRLANALGLTFQQVQKYETGANRISASMLQAVAQALDTTPAWFFEGLPPTAPDDGLALTAASQALQHLTRCPEGLALAEAMAALPRRRQRRVLALLAVMVEDAP